MELLKLVADGLRGSCSNCVALSSWKHSLHHIGADRTNLRQRSLLWLFKFFPLPLSSPLYSIGTRVYKIESIGSDGSSPIPRDDPWSDAQILIPYPSIIIPETCDIIYELSHII